MLVSEASQLVIQAGAMGQGGETFVLDMGEPVRILDLAHDMIRLSGLRVGDDVEVRVIGLRPGEKLYEELFDDGEQKRPTPHPKIRVAVKPQHNLLETVRQINRLEQVANRPAAMVLQTLRSIVPVYRALEETATQPPLRRAA
jgi:FlaA1/EpsC-like NDP-sugar epimerase